MVAGSALLASSFAAGQSIAAGQSVGPTGSTRSVSHFPPNHELESLLRGRIDEGRAVGVVLAVREDDGSTRVVAVGDSGAGSRPLGERSVFEIGSVTKAFTGTLLADMARRGEVELSDPVSDYLPDDVRMPGQDDREITLFDLATHHSALPRLPSNLDSEDSSDPYADYTVEEMYDFLSDLELARKIGSEYEYSNLGVGLLGHVLSRAGGRPYEALVRDRILDPLGMDDTGIPLDEEMRAWMTRGHDAAGSEVPLWHLPTLAGAGALRSSARDLLRFMDANLGEPKSELEHSMRVAQEPRMAIFRGASSAIQPGPGTVRTFIGLNWHIRSSSDSRIVWHDGGTGGFSTFLGFDPIREIGVVVLANSQHSVSDIGLHLLDSDVPLTESPPERVAVDVDADILAEYVGEYRLAPNLMLVVTLEDGTLRVEPTNQPKLPIHPESETRFFVRTMNVQFNFQRNGDGAVTGLILHRDGQEVPARKVR